MLRSIDVVINAGSGGTADETAKEIVSRFGEHGINAHVHELRDGGDINVVIAQAIKGNGDALVACGGDGTVNAVATAALEIGKPLGVLPLGTLNNFSKDLGIPQDLAEAIKVVADAQTERVDAGEVNGQIFINNSSIGLYPRIVRRREQQQRLGRGKWSAAFWAALKVLRFSHFLRVKLIVDGQEIRRKTPFVFVGNNDYDMDLYNIGRRERLDAGRLSVYLLRRGGRWGVIVMLLKTIIGRVKQWDDFEGIHTDELTIVSRKKRLPVAFDGEVAVMETPLEYRTLPRALEVIVPSEEPE
jgi:YegS/Rv2252/BmrU family lipid kinase